MMKRFLTLLLATTLLFTAAACTKKGEEKVGIENIDLSSYPVETDVTLTYFKTIPTTLSTVIENYGETEFSKELEKRTGIKVEYIHPAAGAVAESINLMIASNELCDIIENNWFANYRGGVIRALQDKAIIDINEYKEYAPGFFKLMEENPDWDKACKTDDGRYFGFPKIMGAPRLRISNGPAVRMDWLRDLGLSEPETIEDWEVMLTAFKEKKGATAPLSLNSGGISQLITILGAKNNTYVKGDEIVYGPIQPEWKEAVTIAADWFKKGLLDPNIASVDSKMLTNQIVTGKTGAASCAGGSGIGTYMPAGLQNDPNFDFAGVKFPSRKAGEVSNCSNINHAVIHDSTAAITSQCDYPALAVKFLDYLYTDEGYMFANFGIEGDTYTMVDGVPTYTEKITNNPDGLLMSQALGMYVRASGGSAFSCAGEYIDQYYGLPQQKKALAAWTANAEEATKTVVPAIMPTAEESEEYANLMAEIDKYKAQMLMKFIMGIEPIEKFDDYVAELKRLGVDRAMELQTAALKRFNER